MQVFREVTYRYLDKYFCGCGPLTSAATVSFFGILNLSLLLIFIRHSFVHSFSFVRMAGGWMLSSIICILFFCLFSVIMTKTRFFRILSWLSCSFLLLVLLLPTTTATYSLGIRDSLMIAHSFHHHPAFGPAGGMHGATYTCDVEFHCSQVQPVVNWVLDIGQASTLLQQVLHKYHLHNLDELFPEDTLTTTEFMCRQIHADLCLAMNQNHIPFSGQLTVKLWESHKAWASYTQAVVVDEDATE